MSQNYIQRNRLYHQFRKFSQYWEFQYWELKIFVGLLLEKDWACTTGIPYYKVMEDLIKQFMVKVVSKYVICVIQPLVFWIFYGIRTGCASYTYKTCYAYKKDMLFHLQFTINTFQIYFSEWSNFLRWFIKCLQNLATSIFILDA